MESPSSPPKSVSFDPGSSVSTNMMEEYDDLLRYAVVTPTYLDPAAKPQPTTQSTANRTSSVTHQLKATQTTDSINNDDDSEVEVSDNSNHLPSPPAAVRTKDHRSIELINHTISSGNSEDTDELLRAHLDQWCSEFKSNILAEFAQTKLKFKEQLNSEMQTERTEHAKIVNDLSQDIRGKVELLRVYESSMAKKDDIIMNLTKSLHKQKQQVTMAKTMAMWKFCHMDKQREGFTEKLAIRHRNSTIKLKIFRSWFGLIQRRWKNRVEKACQIRAEQVCQEMTQGYEDKLTTLNRSYDDALHEISILKQSQSVYEENMKKAFMRGVCALNMEAMTMFNETTPATAPPTRVPHQPSSTRHVNIDLNNKRKKMHISVEKH